MASDIQPGDLVVCINAQRIELPHCFANGGGLRRGAIYRATTGIIADEEGDRIIFLADDPLGDEGRLALRFRKLNDEPDNAELIARIKSCQPMKVES